MSMCSVVVSTWCALLMCETSAMTVEPSAPKGEIGCKCLCVRVCMCLFPPPFFKKKIKTCSKHEVVFLCFVHHKVSKLSIFLEILSNPFNVSSYFRYSFIQCRYYTY